MIIVNVFVHVKPDKSGAFKDATIKNARNSILEPGILQFDFMQQEDDGSRFLLTEVYVDKDAIAQHKETDHYALWRETVETMMSEPRKSIKYTKIFPGDKGS